jgi:hypothetical protein
MRSWGVKLDSNKDSVLLLSTKKVFSVGIIERSKERSDSREAAVVLKARPYNLSVRNLILV